MKVYKNSPPSVAEWERLYELAVKLKALEPWEWMDEQDIFGVQNPETGEIGFVSIMGMLGEHLAMGVYLGAEGLHGYWEMSDPMTDLERDPFAMFEVPQLQASFEDREMLEKQDRDIIKKLGLKFRGHQNYPLFRSIKPGFMPYFVQSEEARFLILAMEQTLAMLPRFYDDEYLLPDPDEDLILVRVSEQQNGNLVWRDEIRSVPAPETPEIVFEIPSNLIAELKNVPQNKDLRLEIDLFYAPMPIGEKGKRLFIPKMLLVTDAKRGLVLDGELIGPEETIAESIALIPQHLIKNLLKLKIRPCEISVRSGVLFEAFKTFTQQINIKLRQTDVLPALDEAKESLSNYFESGF
jgi:hypothetical protein